MVLLSCIFNNIASSPNPPPDPCDSFPCQNEGTCSPNGDIYKCECQSGFAGDNCEEKNESPSPGNRSDSNSQLLYGGLAVFIAILVVCVAAYLAYHNRDKVRRWHYT